MSDRQQEPDLAEMVDSDWVDDLASLIGTERMAELLAALDEPVDMSALKCSTSNNRPESARHGANRAPG